MKLWCAATAKSLQLCPTLCNTWTVVCQAPLSVEFPRRKYWSGLPFPFLGSPHPGIEPTPLALARRFFTMETPGKPRKSPTIYFYSFTERLFPCLLLFSPIFHIHFSHWFRELHNNFLKLVMTLSFPSQFSVFSWKLHFQAPLLSEY